MYNQDCVTVSIDIQNLIILSREVKVRMLIYQNVIVLVGKSNPTLTAKTTLSKKF